MAVGGRGGATRLDHHGNVSCTPNPVWSLEKKTEISYKKLWPFSHSFLDANFQRGLA